MNGSDQKLKVGLLVDSYLQPEWVCGLVRDIQASSFAQVALVMKIDTKPGDRLSAPASSWIWRLYQRFDRSVFKTDVDPFQTTDLRAILKDCPIMALASIDDTGSLQTYHLDVALQVGMKQRRQDKDPFTRYGIWFYRHGDHAKRSGMPETIWEVITDQPVTRSSLSVLEQGGQSSRVLSEIWTQTYRFSLYKNQVNSIIQSAPLALRTLRDLSQLGPSALSTHAVSEPVSSYDMSGGDVGLRNIQTANWLLKLCGRVLHQIWLKLFFRGQWCLAYKFSEPTEHPDTQAPYQLMVPPADRFWADPFLWQKDGRDFIFFEECEFKNDKGYISVMEIDAQGAEKFHGKVLERPYHLSYPCLFEHKGELYMVPETADERKVELYRCRVFPNEWVFEKTLLEGVRAADATVTLIEGRWWMFVTLQAPGTYSSDELHLYYADSPLGNWTPHPRNPVKSDIRSARPAGQLFCREGRWYRPAQDGSGNYGSAIVINRIVRLTPDEYAEEEASRILPTWHKAVSRNHTLNSIGRLTVTDGFIFRPRFPWGRVRNN